MSTYPTLTIGPNAANDIGTQPFITKSFRVKGTVKINGKTPVFQSITLTVRHECYGVTVSVTNTNSYTYTYLLKSTNQVITDP